ncbi:MAG: hypothetical protein ABJH05_03565 [Fulvivirga sp.]
MKIAYLNIIGLITVLIVNGMANGLPINGMTTGEISAMYPNLFVPAGITFSIWGLIYLSLIGFCVYPFISNQTGVINRVGYLFLLTCALNVSWILVWHHLMVGFSLIIMLAFLITLLSIYKRCRAAEPTSRLEKWLVYKPFSIYFAWICVATIANTTAFLVSKGFETPSPALWAVAMIIATQLLVWVVNIKYHDIAYTLVVIWALVGITIKQYSLEYDIILYAAVAGIIFSTLNAFYYRYRAVVS